MPILTSLTSCGLSFAIAYIWSRKPPGSSYERHTAKPLAACVAANCCTVWPPLTRVKLRVDAGLGQLVALSLRHDEVDLDAACDLLPVVLEALVRQLLQVTGLDDGGVGVQPVSRGRLTNGQRRGQREDKGRRHGREQPASHLYSPPQEV